LDLERLETLIAEKNYVTLKKELEEMNPVDIADLLRTLDIHKALLFV